jgi:hypothetical protein
MPRERGKPKHGPTYYNFVARQCRLSSSSPPPCPILPWFAITAPLRCLLLPLLRIGWMKVLPWPMSKEEIPSVPPQIPLASLLYTVPDFQAPPNTSGQSTLGIDSALEMETCIIEEEIPSRSTTRRPFQQVNLHSSQLQSQNGLAPVASHRNT